MRSKLTKFNVSFSVVRHDRTTTSSTSISLDETKDASLLGSDLGSAILFGIRQFQDCMKPRDFEYMKNKLEDILGNEDAETDE
jgi:hypothetical protein